MSSVRQGRHGELLWMLSGAITTDHSVIKCFQISFMIEWHLQNYVPNSGIFNGCLNPLFRSLHQIQYDCIFYCQLVYSWLCWRLSSLTMSYNTCIIMYLHAHIFESINFIMIPTQFSSDNHSTGFLISLYYNSWWGDISSCISELWCTRCCMNFLQYTFRDHIMILWSNKPKDFDNLSLHSYFV